ncbi:hypothetical protein SAMN04487895_101746 [Paenibacillus sophorae]|uniref:Ig-like domain (Group 2) n=1 Tax=Paenibacillus sophorae TaxID=1333845 RepID=A0A1H8H497_9BACL|nr:hypothetical protein [Paenibacillus sophorae]QWU14434.1 hypothetical protein KP014_21235 [Paenibacillus sophorae]SEN50839.1 hypothetical protein SAMN04487895_101746 [Paenibacillus sophorae]
MKNYSNYHGKKIDKLRDNAQRLIQSSIMDSLDSQDVLVNGENKRLIINDKYSASQQLKYMIGETIDSLYYGDVVELQNGENWIICSYETENQFYKKWIATLCNFNLKWIDENGIIQSYLSVLTSTRSSNGIEEDNIMTLPIGRRHVIVQLNEHTKKLDRGRRFIIGGEAFKVVDIDHMSVKGLVNLSLQSSGDLNPAKDNLELEIADYYGNVANYKIEILNGYFSTISEDQSLQLNVAVTNNNIPILSPTLFYTSSDESIAEVNPQGVIVPKTNGTVTIRASFKDVSSEIEISVTESTAYSYTCEIIGSSEIKIGRTQTYTAKFYRNGVEYPDESRFSLSADDGVSDTNFATISTQDNSAHICSILAGDNIGYFWLHVKNQNGLSESKIRIKIKPLY